MDFAISAYLGGTTIAATECDYESYRNYGLKCPYCHSAVFLRSESVRKGPKGKLQIVKPYFAHYASGWEDNWDCEKRSHSSEGKREREKMEIQGRNQRLKLYNARLWQMFQTDRNVSYAKLNKVRSLFGEKWIEDKTIELGRSWREDPQSPFFFLEEVLDMITIPSAEQEKYKPVHISQGEWEEEIKTTETWYSGLDRRLHQAICREILEFLTTDTGGFARVNFLKASLFFLLLIGGHTPAEIKGMPNADLTRILCSLLVGTHWSDQIEKFLQ